MNIRGTQTEKNLIQAFTGESQAQNRYKFYASQAEKEGFDVIARTFHELAAQEGEHARCFFEYLQGGKVEFCMTIQSTKIGDTRANLRAAAQIERVEWSDLYPKFAEEARSEGFDEVANRFQSIAFCERQHEIRFSQILKRLESNTLFHSDSSVKWQCTRCGYVLDGTDAPEKCPACDGNRGAFQMINDEL
ncbi:MAG: rubrerythrin family protein [Thermoguttaceae bacterium]|nr:rubrerythrin family protein [Thermoguttaceae bacterium]MBQ9456783.1 rubrerythrin family protein [Thermoguttaceae bacterium]